MLVKCRSSLNKKQCLTACLKFIDIVIVLYRTLCYIVPRQTVRALPVHFGVKGEEIVVSPPPTHNRWAPLARAHFRR